jgi:glutathione S-transferase
MAGFAVVEGNARVRPLERQSAKTAQEITAGHIALRACLGYIDLRFPGQWEKGRSRLKRWAVRFDEKFPELKQYVPA